MSGLYNITESGELTRHLSTFETIGCMCVWLKDNRLTTKLDLFWVLTENRRLTKSNVRKWGQLAFEKLTNGKVRYSRLEVVVWMYKNKGHFEAVDE